METIFLQEKFYLRLKNNFKKIIFLNNKKNFFQKFLEKNFSCVNDKC